MANGAIVTFNVSVLLWLSWLDVFHMNAICFSPCLEHAADIFGAVINPNELWFASSFNNPVQAANDA